MRPLRSGQGVLFAGVMWFFIQMVPSVTWASTNLSIFGVAALPRPQSNIPGSPMQGVVSYGVGATLELYTLATLHSNRGGGITWVIPSLLGFEVGGLYLERNYNESSGSRVRVSMVQIPLLLTTSWGNILTFGFGAYYGYAYSVRGDAGAVSPALTYSSFKDEWGIAASGRINLFPLSPFGAWVGVRYFQSFTTAASAGTLTYIEPQALVGLRLGKME